MMLGKFFCGFGSLILAGRFCADCFCSRNKIVAGYGFSKTLDVAYGFAEIGVLRN
jgi:hypothetical protein